MSAIQQLLIEHIDIWTGAEIEKKSGRGRASNSAVSVYGIKKLRELILELAVRGKLVPQSAADEPASRLLERIKVEKNMLFSEGIIKKEKHLPLIHEDEKPFVVPSGWGWVRLGDVLLKITDGTHHSPTNSSVGEFKYISAKNIRSKGIDLSDITYVTTEVHDEIYARCDPEFGDILYIKDGATTGIATINTLKEPFSMLSSVALLKPSAGIDNHFLLNSITAPFFYAEMRSEMTGVAITRVTLGKLNSAIIPLPPLDEQHRIVAKVDELMALCDQLEDQHRDAADTHEQLVSHLLSTLTQSQSPADFNANWQRIAAHFSTLFTTEASIDALKQTLLQLAVMGKLVAQDTNDEPASELLERIAAEKAKLVSDGKIKKEKLQATIGADEKPFDLPKNWEWIRLGTLVEKSGAGWSPSCEGHARTGNSWGVLKVSSVSWGEFLPNENKALPKSLDARIDCAVESGDFLITRANTEELVARSVVVEDCPPNLMLSDKIIRLRLSLLCNSKFINLVNLSPFSRNYYALAAGGTSSSMKNVTREQILNLVVGKPPLAEQHRIVEKVDELMDICYKLRSRITVANQQQKKLADVLVEHAVIG